MGITAKDVELLEVVIGIDPNIKSVLELGSQNLYLNNEKNPPFASEWYVGRGMKYTCIDLAGDNMALKIDLSKPIELVVVDKGATPGPSTMNPKPLDFKPFKLIFDLVTDFGTSEHVVRMKAFTSVPFHDGHINSIYPDGVEDALLGFYHCWKNKHDVLKKGGFMVNVNPKTGNWPDHGYHYYTLAFYEKLAELCGYQIIQLEEHAAMGNVLNGWNICCILMKLNDKEFISLEEFKTLDIREK